MATQPQPNIDYYIDTILVGGKEYSARFAIWGSGDLSDATATPADILQGKTAYTGDGLITGTLVPSEELYWENF